MSLQELQIPKLIFAAGRTPSFYGSGRTNGPQEYFIFLHQPAQKRTLFFAANGFCPQGRLQLWFPPIIFRLQLLQFANKSILSSKVITALFAEDNPQQLRPETRLYYIPLPNFNYSACCLGEFDLQSSTIDEAVKQMVNRFYDSYWAAISHEQLYYIPLSRWVQYSKKKQFMPISEFSPAFVLKQILPTHFDECRIEQMSFTPWADLINKLQSTPK